MSRDPRCLSEVVAGLVDHNARRAARIEREEEALRRALRMWVDASLFGPPEEFVARRRNRARHAALYARACLVRLRQTVTVGVELAACEAAAAPCEVSSAAVGSDVGRWRGDVFWGPLW